jgi:glycosyltransferase involved in cell wall biosynthesis
VRVLWAKYGKILPLDTGGKLRSFNLLRELSHRTDLTFFSYHDGPRDMAYESELDRELPGSVVMPVADLPSSRLSVMRRFARSALSPVPFTITRYTSPAARARAADLMRQHRYDVAVCDFLTPTLTLPAAMASTQGIPAVLFEHNVESDLWRRRYLSERRPAARVIYWWESRRMRSFEARMLSAYQRVLAVSAHDKERLLALAPGVQVDVVPTGVDLRRFHPDPDRRGCSGLVVFVGSMDWEPNVDGAEWFCDSVWPLVREQVPGATFRIVGRSPGPRVQRLSGPSVEVTGSVSSVVEHLREAAAVVVPLRVGGGTRLKIYEAMATGCAVVSTTIGAEGLDVQDGKNILLRDAAGPFADALTGLLRNLDERLRIGKAASQHALQYDWPRVAERLEAILHNARRAPQERLA